MAHFPSRVDLSPRKGRGPGDPELDEAIEQIRHVFPENTTARSGKRPPAPSLIEGLYPLAHHSDDRVFEALATPMSDWYVTDPYIAYLVSLGMVPRDDLKFLRRPSNQAVPEYVEACAGLWREMTASAMSSLAPVRPGSPSLVLSHRMDFLLAHALASRKVLLDKVKPLPYPRHGTPDPQTYLPPELEEVLTRLLDHMRGSGLRDAMALAASRTPSLDTEVARLSPSVGDPDLIVKLADCSDPIAIFSAVVENRALSHASTLLLWDWVLSMVPQARLHGIVDQITTLLRQKGFTMPDDVRRRARLMLKVSRDSSGRIADGYALFPDLVTDSSFWKLLELDAVSSTRTKVALRHASGHSWVRIARTLVGDYETAATPSRKIIEVLGETEDWQLENVSRGQLIFMISSRSAEIRDVGRMLASRLSSIEKGITL